MEIVSVSVPTELREKMKKIKFVNWSQVATAAFERRVSELEILEAFASNSKLTEKDALEIGAKINAGIARRVEAELAKKKKQAVQ